MVCHIAINKLLYAKDVTKLLQISNHHKMTVINIIIEIQVEVISFAIGSHKTALGHKPTKIVPNRVTNLVRVPWPVVKKKVVCFISYLENKNTDVSHKQKKEVHSPNQNFLRIYIWWPFKGRWLWKGSAGNRIDGQTNINSRKTFTHTMNINSIKVVSNERGLINAQVPHWWIQRQWWTC